MHLPFFYGWLIVAVTFVTMAIGVNARTAFSLFFPPIISEFGWERGVTAGAFSFGFVVSAGVSPLIGRMMDRFGPRGVMELGVLLMGGGLLLAPLTTQPWHLYLTIGVLVGAGSVCLGYSGQSLFLPNWFIRRRGLAMGLAFAGVGIGSVTLLPWVQHMIEQTGWRTACTAMGILVLAVLAPINFLLRKRPEDIGLRPDGDAAPSATSAAPRWNVVDPVCAGTDWPFRRVDRAEIRAGVAAGLSHDLHARRARLRPDVDHGRGGAGNLSGQAIWQHFRHYHAGRTGRRRRGPMGDRAAVRSFGQLHAGL